MNKNYRLDEIARILASPMPRRQALGRILGVFAGAALATIVLPGRADAQTPQNCTKDADCGFGKFCCNKNVCCSTGAQCCGSGANSLCCPSAQVCCGSGANTVCCSPGQICDNSTCKTNVSP